MAKSTFSPEFKLKAVQDIAEHHKRPVQIWREYNVFAPRRAVGLSRAARTSRFANPRVHE